MKQNLKLQLNHEVIESDILTFCMPFKYRIKFIIEIYLSFKKKKKIFQIPRLFLIMDFQKSQQPSHLHQLLSQFQLFGCKP